MPTTDYRYFEKWPGVAGDGPRYTNALKDLKLVMEEGGQDVALLYLEGQGCEVPLCDSLVKLLCAVAGDNIQIPVQVSTKKQAAILVGRLVTVFNEMFKIDGPNTLILPNDESVSFWAKLIRASSSKYLSGDGLDDGNFNPILSENTHSEFSKSIFKFGGLAIWKNGTLAALAQKKKEDKVMLCHQHRFGFMLASVLSDIEPVPADFLSKIKQMFVVYIGDEQDQGLPEDRIVFDEAYFEAVQDECDATLRGNHSTVNGGVFDAMKARRMFFGSAMADKSAPFHLCVVFAAVLVLYSVSYLVYPDEL
ncbi:hypothetical protein IV203_026999 [Nitzschia inconspicua]|uniref:Uncharacterized protein n=1 Tax=Nitzschia inconspicua TaxID=303405 RepID=A0A9K3LK97_9STRA|nr:hypothetical protein IV203_026999 [Nitzschia inconspicua]